MGMDHALARRVGVALACPLTGHISKGHAKGVLRNRFYRMEVEVTVGEGRLEKIAEQFLPTMGVLGGGAH
jgi:hypothetical protein